MLSDFSFGVAVLREKKLDVRVKDFQLADIQAVDFGKL
jgi:hypothetical protein